MCTVSQGETSVCWVSSSREWTLSLNNCRGHQKDVTQKNDCHKQSNSSSIRPAESWSNGSARKFDVCDEHISYQTCVSRPFLETDYGRTTSRGPHTVRFPPFWYRMVRIVSYGRELLRSASSMIPKQAKQQPQVVFSCRSSLPYRSPRYDCNGRGSQPAGCRRRWLAVPHGRRSCPQGMYRTAGCIRQQVLPVV
jgi:hypothetical protein